MIKTEAIVLRAIDYSESSQIATVLSREHGKIALMVRGGRKPRSPFSGMFEPGQLLKVIYTYKGSRSVQTLTEADYDVRLDRLRREVPRMALSMSTLELVSQLVHDGEVNEPVYEFTRSVLIWIDTQDEVRPVLFPYVQVRLAHLLGLELQAADAGKILGGGYLNIEIGRLSEKPETAQAVRLNQVQIRFLVNCCKSRKVSVLDQPFSRDDLKELIDVMDRYFRYHLDGLTPRRSDAIFESILND